jgi:hypothetical protein
MRTPLLPPIQASYVWPRGCCGHYGHHGHPGQSHCRFTGISNWYLFRGNLREDPDQICGGRRQRQWVVAAATLGGTEGRDLFNAIVVIANLRRRDNPAVLAPTPATTSSSDGPQSSTLPTFYSPSTPAEFRADACSIILFFQSGKVCFFYSMVLLGLQDNLYQAYDVRIYLRNAHLSTCPKLLTCG